MKTEDKEKLRARKKESAIPREVYVFTSAATIGICLKSIPRRTRKRRSARRVDDGIFVASKLNEFH